MNNQFTLTPLIRIFVMRKIAFLTLTILICFTFLGTFLFSSTAIANYCPFGGCKGENPKELYKFEEDAELLLSFKGSYLLGINDNLSKGWEFLNHETYSHGEAIEFGAQFSNSTGVCSAEFILMVPRKGSFDEYVDKIHSIIEYDTSYKGEKFELEDTYERNSFRWKEGNVKNVKGVKQILFSYDKKTDSPLGMTISVVIFYDNYEKCREQGKDIPPIPR